MPATARGRRLALVVVAVSVAIFLALLPFAKVQLAPVVAFIPMYQSAMIVNDVVTAALLFGQFSILRSRAMLALASAYLFTAFLAAYHAMSFPGLFAPTGLLGAGPQSTAWLYMFWHAGFPLLVIAYALLKPVDAARGRVPGRTTPIVLATVSVVFVIATAFALLATRGHAALPPIMAANHSTPLMIGVVSSGV